MGNTKADGNALDMGSNPVLTFREAASWVTSQISVKYSGTNINSINYTPYNLINDNKSGK